MNILIVSDDNFFSSGLSENLKNKRVEIENKSVSDFEKSNATQLLKSYDKVILDINSDKDFKKVLSLHDMPNNIIFIIDIPKVFIGNNSCFFSKRSSLSEFIVKIKNDIDFECPQVETLEFVILLLSNAGQTISLISNQLNITEKTIYRLRGALMQKIGFIYYHPLTAIYCEKILMQTMHRDSTNELFGVCNN